MSIEINYERLEQLSIADLIHLRDYYYAQRKWLPRETKNFGEAWDKLDQCHKAVESAFEAKLKDIFILD